MTRATESGTRAGGGGSGIRAGGGGSGVIGFVPTDITGLLAWYDASNTASITDAGAGAVSQWNDLSGGGRHLTQATAGSRPITGTLTQNGRNVIDFDGTDDFLGRTPAMMWAATGGDTAIVVVKIDNTTGTPAVLSEALTTDADVITRHGASTQLAQHIMTNFGGTNEFNLTSADIVNGNYHILRTTDSKTVGTLCVDRGTPVGSASYVRNAPGPDRFAVGCDYKPTPLNFLDGQVAEIVIYQGVLTAGQILSIENYLATKWGL